MDLYLARHTETDYNVKGLINSDPTVNITLTPRGIKQAKELATQLQAVSFDMIFCSMMQRTYQTAEFIAKRSGLTITRNALLNDLMMGFEGKHIDEYRQPLLASDDMWNIKFNDGESLNELLTRVDNFLDYLKTLNNPNNVLIVSHMSVIQLMTGRLRGVSPADSLNIEVEQGGYTKERLPI